MVGEETEAAVTAEEEAEERRRGGSEEMRSRGTERRKWIMRQEIDTDRYA